MAAETELPVTYDIVARLTRYRQHAPLAMYCATRGVEVNGVRELSPIRCSADFRFHENGSKVWLSWKSALPAMWRRKPLKKDCFGGPRPVVQGQSALSYHQLGRALDSGTGPVALFRQYGLQLFVPEAEQRYYTDLRAEIGTREDFILLPCVEASSWLVQPPMDPAALQGEAALKEKMLDARYGAVLLHPWNQELAQDHTSTESWATEAMQRAAETSVLHHGERTDTRRVPWAIGTVCRLTQQGLTTT